MSSGTGFVELSLALFTNSSANLRSIVVFPDPGCPKINNLPATSGWLKTFIMSVLSNLSLGWEPTLISLDQGNSI